jgi:apolipoprotein N-acyltransferase
MASLRNLKSAQIGLVCALTTAVLAWLGAGLFPVWPLMWFAPVPVLLFAMRSQTWWAAALVAAIGWGVGNLRVPVFYVQGGAPLVFLGLYTSLVSATLVCAVLLFRAFVRRGRVWLALLAFPACWTSLEFLNSLVSVHGSFGSVAYTQLDFLPFLQLASLTGPWGMSFLLMLFPAALALGLHLYRAEPRRTSRIFAATGGLLAAALVFGALRLSLPAPAQRLKVGLIASDPPTSPGVADPGALTTKLLGQYAAEATKLVARGAQVIVMPEKLAVIVGSDTRSLDAQYQSLADHGHVTLVAGLVHVIPPLRYNEARVYTPRAPVQTYDKQHLLPGAESDLTPGASILTLHEPTGLWGVAICKDMDFRKPAQDYGKAGVGLLLVPAWDFVADRWLHGHIAVMRGVEDGFGIVRAAKEGDLTVSDDRGRILAETTSYSAPFTTLMTEVPAVHDRTLYQVLGDWFGWVAVALLALALLRLLGLLPIS